MSMDFTKQPLPFGKANMQEVRRLMISTIVDGPSKRSLTEINPPLTEDERQEIRTYLQAHPELKTPKGFDVGEPKASEVVNESMDETQPVLTISEKPTTLKLTLANAMELEELGAHERALEVRESLRRKREEAEKQKDRELNMDFTKQTLPFGKVNMQQVRLMAMREIVEGKAKGDLSIINPPLTEDERQIIKTYLQAHPELKTPKGLDVEEPKASEEVTESKDETQSVLPTLEKSTTLKLTLANAMELEELGAHDRAMRVQESLRKWQEEREKQKDRELNMDFSKQILPSLTDEDRQKIKENLKAHLNLKTQNGSTQEPKQYLTLVDAVRMEEEEGAERMLRLAESLRKKREERGE